jgi:hypothetical protein
LNYSGFSPDASLASLATFSPQGNLPPGSIVIGSLVSNTGRSLSEATVSISPFVAGATFDPSRVFVAICADIDGVSAEDPLPPGSTPDAVHGSVYQPVGDPSPPPVNSIHRAYRVLSSQMSGFRLKVLNLTGIPLNVAANYNQCWSPK